MLRPGAMDPVKVLIFGTIATAEDFENDDLFVHFFFHLENGWTSSCPLFGVTQCSRTRPKGRVEVAHFSHPFELELERTAGDGDQEGLAVVGRLFVEVLSLDCWNRLRVEGYAYCDLLESPGQRELSLLTWRPLSRSLVSRMRRFFTGGDPPLEDLCAAGAPTAAASSGQDGDAERSKRLSRYSLCTESSGTVKVLLNVVRQTTFKARETEIARRVLGSIGRQVSQSSITAALASFHRARSRMLAARARHTALAQT
ncbi:tectonic-like complex member MKS1 isoform X2 [Dermacentor albipictus]|uniref:tectonic-like complex member MKS1 isoform X2 n=1 Tax=Dermacentor albipictus TaxID=60249 RepID=UPI0038FCDD18